MPILSRHKVEVIQGVLQEISSNSCLPSATVTTLLEELEVPETIFVAIISEKIKISPLICRLAFPLWTLQVWPASLRCAAIF